MRYAYDCEFIEDGRTIDLVSIGIAAEDGREYYAVSTEFDERRAGRFVRRHVLPLLPSPSDGRWRSRSTIRDEVLAFLTEPGGEVELWAWKGAYDHVALVQLWGDMPALPRAVPRFTHELVQLWEAHGRPALPAPPEGREHDALLDARLALQRLLLLSPAAPSAAP